MAIMVRPKGKGKIIAYAILGVPCNVASKKTSRERRIDANIHFDIRRQIR